VTADNRTSSYTYDDFGNALTVQTSAGTTTNVYSGIGQSDTYLPPSLLSSTDPAAA